MVANTQMNHRRCPEASEASLVVLTEAERAARLRRSHRVVECGRRYWVSVARGVYEPVHDLARFSVADTHRPTWECWAYRAALTVDDSCHANGFFPIHLADVEGYGTMSLCRTKRQELAKCLRSVRFVHVKDAQVLQAEGWEAISAAAKRIPISMPRSRKDYCDWAERVTADETMAVIAGFHHDTLAGYVTANATDDTGYLVDLVVPGPFLETGISTGLYYHVMQMFQRLGSIRQVSAGRHAPENEGLSSFKARIGFPVVYVPARYSMMGLPAQMMRRWKPNTYYRFTGVDPKRACTVIE